ncbi:MAG: ABC transporter permease [SAR324 cluster bacterium]|jgi:ABC-type multidrug transport system permease subunit|nr:ABC transporter permease [SAR324 cluster bacterium]
MNSILFQLVISQFKLFFREPGVVFWSFGFPVVMAWILGIAFANKGEILRNVAIVTENPAVVSALPKWLHEKSGTVDNQLSGEAELEWEVGMNAGDQARFRFRAMSEEEAVLALKRGQISLWIEGSPETNLSYRFDPDNADARLTYLLLETAFREKISSEIKAEIRPLTMVGIRYVDFLIPGLMAMSIMNACLWGIGWNLIELRIKKLLRRIVATPLRKSIFLISHGLNRMILSAAEMLLLYIFAYFYFDIRIQGSLLALALVFLSGYCAFAGIAILISSRVQNTQSGNGMINIVTMPMFILSGIFFSYHNFPDWLIPYVEVLPLTMLTNSLRGIITEGIGLAQVIQPSLGLFGIGAVCFALGLKLYLWH